MKPFHNFERRIDKLMRDLFGDKSDAGQGREMVEVQRLILDMVHDRVQLLPRARRAFPFNDVAVRIPVPDADRRAAYEMVFVADDALQHEIVEFLRREDVEFPTDLRVRVTLIETDEIAEPSIVCARRTAPPAELAPPGVPPPSLATVRFAVPSGDTVEVQKPRIHIGRHAEVLDERRRLVRRNDLVLDDGTVSRAHAHVEFDARSGEFRLFDDGSSYGTSVIHEGRLMDVPKAGARGFRLQPGDEIYFGQVRVRFDLV